MISNPSQSIEDKFSFNAFLELCIYFMKKWKSTKLYEVSLLDGYLVDMTNRKYLITIIILFFSHLYFGISILKNIFPNSKKIFTTFSKKLSFWLHVLCLEVLTAPLFCYNKCKGLYIKVVGTFLPSLVWYSVVQT